MMEKFIEVTAIRSKIGKKIYVGKMLLEITNIQCVFPEDDGCRIVLKSKSFNEKGCTSSFYEFNEVIVKEDYDTIHGMLI